MVPLVCYMLRNAAAELSFANGNFQLTKSIRWNTFYCPYRKPDRILVDTFDCNPWTKMRSGNASAAQRTCACRNYLFSFGIRNDRICYPIRTHSPSVRYHNQHCMLRLWDSLTGKRERPDCRKFSLSVRTWSGKRYRQSHKPVRWLYLLRCTVHRIGKWLTSVWYMLQYVLKLLLVWNRHELIISECALWSSIMLTYKHVAWASSHSVLYVFESVPQYVSLRPANNPAYFSLHVEASLHRFILDLHRSIGTLCICFLWTLNEMAKLRPINKRKKLLETFSTHPQFNIFNSQLELYMFPSLPQTIFCSTLVQSIGQSSIWFPAVPVRSWLIQNEIGTSNMCLPQFDALILQADAYKRPSDPHVGRATRQQDSRHIRVLWQCLRFVLTFYMEISKTIFNW